MAHRRRPPERGVKASMESGQIQIKADTIAELAEKLGVPADKLQESVDGYNAAYEAGKDVKFDVPAQFLSEIKTAPIF